MDTNNKSNIQKESDKKLNIVKKVLGILFCVIILMLSCFIYTNGKESNASQSSMYETEQQQISEMTEYLSGIDESVSTNMEQLAQAAVMQTNAEGTLKEVTNTLSGMEKQITEVEKVLSDTVIENMDSSTTVLKESLSETKTELVNQIEEGNKNIQNTLSETNTNIDEAENNISENINFSTSSIINSTTKTREELKKQIGAVNKDISNILSDMNNENENNFQETYEKIENLQSELEKTEKSMENYYKDLTALINEFQKQNTKEHKEILDTLLKAQEELNKYLDNSFESLNLRLDEDMSNLMDELTVLHNQIITTQNDLTDILNIMEQNDSERQEEVKSMFADTKNYLSYIEETFTDAHSKLQNLIIKFQEKEEANHSETLNVLQVMENDMQETTENGFNNLTETMNSFETSLNSTLDTMQENIFSKFTSTNSKIEDNFQATNDNLNQKFSNLTTQNTETLNTINNNLDEKFTSTNSKIEDNFQTTNDTLNQNFSDLTTQNNTMLQTINNNLDEKVSNLTTTINTYSESTGSDLEEIKTYLNQRLEQVFTSVSNGKASLASALLTIGTNLGKQDATFEEICNAIIHSQDVTNAAVADNIANGKQAWVQGVLVTGNGAGEDAAYRRGVTDGLNQALSGVSITYVYHKHTDACIRTCTYKTGKWCNGGYLCNNCDGYRLRDYCTWQSDHTCDPNKNRARHEWWCYGCQGDDDSRVMGGDYAAHRSGTFTHTYYACGKTESTIESATIVLP